jgi:hypothetical protein
VISVDDAKLLKTNYQLLLFSRLHGQGRKYPVNYYITSSPHLTCKSAKPLSSTVSNCVLLEYNPYTQHELGRSKLLNNPHQRGKHGNHANGRTEKSAVKHKMPSLIEYKPP